MKVYLIKESTTGDTLFRGTEKDRDKEYLHLVARGGDVIKEELKVFME